MKEVHLKRSLSRLNVWSIALGSIIGWGAFVMPGDVFLPTAGPLGSTLGILIGAIIMMIISISYGYMITRYPVAGGEFEYSLRSFGQKHAFICAWFLSISYISVIPLNATALGLIGRYMFPGVLQKGYLYTIAGWEVYLGEVLLASAALIIFAYISIKGVKISGTIQTTLTFLLIGSVFILTVIALIKGDITNLKPLYPEGKTKISSVLIIISVAPWAYVGFDTIPQTAEEFKFSPQKALGLMLISILFGAFIYIAMNISTAIVFPWKSFLDTEPFWATGIAIETLLGNIGLLLLAIALTTAISSGIVGFFTAASRLLYSMAREDVLPSWFGQIHSKYQTPKNSVLFILLVSLVTPWFGRAVLGWIVDMASMGAAIGYFYTAASAYRLAKEEKGNLVIKFFSIVGALFGLSFVALLVIPGMPSFLKFPSWIVLIIWSFLGYIFYKTTLRKKSNTLYKY